MQLEQELQEHKDLLRSCQTELETRTKESEYIVKLLEEFEEKQAIQQEKEKQAQALLTESKKRIDQATLE